MLNRLCLDEGREPWNSMMWTGSHKDHTTSIFNNQIPNIGNQNNIMRSLHIPTKLKCFSYTPLPSGLYHTSSIRHERAQFAADGDFRKRCRYPADTVAPYHLVI
jgi:hypothetical protein